MNIDEILTSQNTNSTVQAPFIDKHELIIRDSAYALASCEPLQYIVDGLISAGSVSIWYGEPGSKKTFSALSLGVCIALGKKWLNFNTSQQRVLIMDEESGDLRMRLRLAAALRGEGGDEKTPIFYSSLFGLQMDNPDHQQEMTSVIHEYSIGYVICDALADMMYGDENSKKDVQPILSAFRKLAEESGAAMHIIHHANKSGGYRGSSAIKGAVDNMIHIESHNDSKIITFTSEKMRDAEPISFSAEAAWNGDKEFFLKYAGSSKKTQKYNESQSYVLQFLLEHGNSALKVIEENAAGCSSSGARQALYKLADKKGDKPLVYRTNITSKGRGAVAYYNLTERGRDVANNH